MGGRMGDLFQASNTNSTFSCVNVSGNAVFLSGNSAVQYQVTAAGSVPLAGISNPLFGSKACSDALRALVSQSSTHLLENEHARVMRRSIDANTVLSGALSGGPAFATPFPTQNSLADQLKLVARMISNASVIGAKR